MFPRRVQFRSSKTTALLLAVALYVIYVATILVSASSISTKSDNDDEPGIRIVGVEEPKQKAKECEAAKTFAVFGAGGETGHTVIDYLLQQKHKVRVISKNPDKWVVVKNVYTRTLTDFEDPNQYEKAFAKCDGAFISPHLPYKAEDYLAEANRSMLALRKGLERAKVPKVVIISSIGAHLDPAKHPIGTIATSYWMEQVFKDFPAPVTFLRAAWVLDNYKSLALTVPKQQGVLPSFITPFDMKIPMVSNFDMGVWAAKTLLDKWEGVRALEVQGPTPLSPLDVVDAVGKALKITTLKPVGVPETFYKDLFKSVLGPSALELWKQTIKGFNSGVIKFEGGVSKTVLGETTHEDIVQTWFDDHAKATAAAARASGEASNGPDQQDKEPRTGKP